MLALRFLLLIGLSLAAPCLSAQTASDLLDVIYVVAGAQDEGDLVMGEVPDRLAQLFPLGATPVATLRGSYAIGRVEQGADAATSAYASAPPPGWRTHDGSVGPEGGFASNVSYGGGILLCEAGLPRPDAPVRVEFKARPGGGSFVVAQDGGWSRRLCDGTEQSHPMDSGAGFESELIDLPALGAPAGSRVQVSGGGGSTDYQRQDATMMWDGIANAALAHYGQQLEEAGWTGVSAGGSADVAAGTWSMGGAPPHTVTLEVVRSGPDEFSLRLTLASHGS